MKVVVGEADSLAYALPVGNRQGDESTHASMTAGLWTAIDKGAAILFSYMLFFPEDLGTREG